jgi:hypothetical protein
MNREITKTQTGTAIQVKVCWHNTIQLDQHGHFPDDKVLKVPHMLKLTTISSAKRQSSLSSLRKPTALKQPTGPFTFTFKLSNYSKML